MDPQEATNLVSAHKKPKVPPPQRMDGGPHWRTAKTFDNWRTDLCDYLMIHNVDPYNAQDRNALAYTNGYLDGEAKEYMRNWRNKEMNQKSSLIDFLNELRTFCVPSNDMDKLWEEFQQIRQTTNGRSRPIQEVATELQILKLRIPYISQKQLYYQFKNAMDHELSLMVSPHINPKMEWQEMVDLAMKFDENRRKKNYNFKQPLARRPYSQPALRRFTNNNSRTHTIPFFNPTGQRINNNNHQKKWTPRNTYNNNRKPNTFTKDISKIQCFHCKQLGHYANKCPKKTIRSAAQTVRWKPTFNRKPTI
jgi:hypothetical protein